MKRNPADGEGFFLQIRNRARHIILRFPIPDFYTDFPIQHQLSREFFETNSVILRLYEFVAQHIDNDLGHGLNHSVKVTLDAGALMLIECGLTGQTSDYIYRQLLIVQCAGLLHDFKRKSENHAVVGAEFSKQFLKTFPLTISEIGDVYQAIRNHEAFKKTLEIKTPEGQLVSDCLYDADKFRWGPDNFSDTIWDMVAYFKTTKNTFLNNYPKGMEKISKIRSTFRTNTGKTYGPQFIDMGIVIGQELFEVIEKEFN